MKLGLFLMIGVTMTAADMSGRYHLTGQREMGSELMLKPDGTFEFMWAYGSADYWGRGTWKRDHDVVILTSADSKLKPPFGLVKSAQGKAGETRIRVVGPRGNPVPDIEVYLMVDGDEPIQRRTDSDGVALIETKSAGKRSVVFEIPEALYRGKALPLDDAAMHDFTFEINGEAVTEMRFENELLIIKGEDLLMQHWPNGPQMRYTK